jgi:lipopolysaccharide biosynthesis glycosyltransferase
MNYALRGRVKTLPFKFNSYFWQALPSAETLPACVEAYLRPVIVHYIGNPKPNKLGRFPVNSPDWERYYRYKARTPFYSECDEQAIETYRRREANLLDSLVFNWKTEDYKYHVYNYTRYYTPQLFAGALKFCERYNSEAEYAVWGLNDMTWVLVAYLAANGIRVTRVVDGLAENRTRDVFGIGVMSPESLQASKNVTLLDMRSKKFANEAARTLKSWGYEDSEVFYVYESLWDGVPI